jgi:hypothetical protein
VWEIVTIVGVRGRGGWTELAQSQTWRHWSSSTSLSLVRPKALGFKVNENGFMHI